MNCNDGEPQNSKKISQFLDFTNGSIKKLGDLFNILWGYQNRWNLIVQ